MYNEDEVLRNDLLKENNAISLGKKYYNRYCGTAIVFSSMILYYIIQLIN